MFLNTLRSAVGSLWKAVELLGGGASLEEVDHCGWVFRISNLAVLPVCSLLSDCRCGQLPCSFHHVFPACVLSNHVPE